MVEGEVFLMKQKHQYHLFQWGECVHDDQTWKEMKLLCESMFILIDKRTLILKNGRKRSFSYEMKASMLF